MATFEQIPSSYEGREQALIKHKLLENYLEKLFLIVGTGRQKRVKLCYVDCFAGPWGDDSGDMKATSIAISLAVLRGCGEAFTRLGISAHIRTLYIEKDKSAFKRLSEFLKTSTPQGIESHCLQGDFVDLRNDILSWVGVDGFAFFFIDPKGWKEVSIPTLRLLLERPRSEFLINFMYNFVNRTMSMSEWQPAMEKLLGAQIDVVGLSPEERESRILTTYRNSLKSCVPTSAGFPARSAYVRVLKPGHDRTHYHLVYVTSHPRGIVEFMQISEGVDLVQRQVRADKRDVERERRTGTPDMFGSDVSVDGELAGVSPGVVDEFWMNYLASGERRVGQPEFATILESTNWFPGDLQASLLRLIAQGKIKNLDAANKRPKKPLHFDQRDGERLVRL
jgi:three-Cys-motif partner protein